MELNTLTAAAAQAGCTVTPQASMAALTTLRIGGAADVLIRLPDAAAAAAVLRVCRDTDTPWLLLGNGSNLLVGDRGIRGAVLQLSGGGTPALLSDGCRLHCAAGVPLSRLCIFARDRSLSGLEFAFGIPGTLGGAVYMNAGAYGGEMAQIVEKVEGVTAGGEPVELSAAALSFDYRHSALMTDAADEALIVTGVTLRLTPGRKEAITVRMRELMQRRQEKQPLEYPSAGSFFKRPEGHYAGALIEQAGLKGCRIGGAQISEKHAGFLINRGGATAADVTALCRHVQDTVLERSGIRLEPEVRFVGQF